MLNHAHHTIVVSFDFGIILPQRDSGVFILDCLPDKHGGLILKSSRLTFNKEKGLFCTGQ